jgi:hypothetical protein
VSYKLSTNEFLERFEREFKQKNLQMEDKLAIQGLDLDTLVDILGPCSECEDVGDFAGPVVLWHFGDKDNICVLIFHIAISQVNIVARRYSPDIDRYCWTILEELHFLPSQLFKDVCWVIWAPESEENQIVGSIRSESFEPVSRCGSLLEAEALIQELKKLGSLNTFEVRKENPRKGRKEPTSRN